jgi:phage shock protein C
MTTKKFLRSKNKKIGGVCSGLSNFFGVDESLIRLIFLIGIFTPFPTILVYFIIWFITPIEKN